MANVTPDTPDRETFFPTEENLGRNCMYWGVIAKIGCNYPKEELNGRTSCEGIVDDVCLYIKDGREAISLTPQQQLEIKLRTHGLNISQHLPPGETI